jgi:hypothetical protein
MKKERRIALILPAGLACMLAIAFFIYISVYYRAEDGARLALKAALADGSVTTENNLMFFHSGKDDGPALIFYPGAKVEATAYVRLLANISRHGITCVLVQMPFRLAFFDSSAADEVFGKLPHIRSWYIGGHSLGGAMASSYMSRKPDRLAGLVLLGAYRYGAVERSKVLTIYGANDQILNRKKIAGSDKPLVIGGGNHAYFANYGKQDGDGGATITQDSQQAIAAEAIAQFILRAR